MLKTRATCRSCGAASLTNIMSLGEQRLASNFSISDDYLPVERCVPLELVRCNPRLNENACGLVQLRHTVPPSLMYANYGYRSGVNLTMREHLAEIARYVEQFLPTDRRPTIVDIGANDGTLLSAYKEGELIGFEPSDVKPIEAAQKVNFVHDYFRFDAANAGKVDAITSIAMFYDLEDPTSFVEDVREMLAPDGVWVLELSYLPLMLSQNSFDTICHEHVAYYSLSSLEHLLDRCGMSVVDVSLNTINGGSFRVAVAHRKSARANNITSDARARLYMLRKHEFELRLDDSDPFNQFKKAVQTAGNNLTAFLRTANEQGKKVYGYGASTKGNVILQSCSINESHLVAIADRNPDKVGGRTVGSNIPIISEEEMRAAKPDYLLALPWHFMDEFLEREKELIAQGTKFVVPLPELKVLP
jgi:hypothetical protein